MCHQRSNCVFGSFRRSQSCERQTDTTQRHKHREAPSAATAAVIVATMQRRPKFERTENEAEAEPPWQILRIWDSVFIG